MLQQLRIYTIDEGNYGRFLEAWFQGVYPLRHKVGWQIEVWTVPAEHKLVWILSRDCTMEEWQEKEREYHASPDRLSLDPDPGQWVVGREELWLEGFGTTDPHHEK